MGGILSSDRQFLFCFLQQHFSVLDPLFIGVVRPWFLPVCSEEVDSVCWSPIGQYILSHWHLLEIIMLFAGERTRLKNKTKTSMFAYHQLRCSVIWTGLRVGDHLRVGHGASPGYECFSSALWKCFCFQCFQSSLSHYGQCHQSHTIHIIRTSCHLCCLNGLSVQLDRPAMVLSPSPAQATGLS